MINDSHCHFFSSRFLELLAPEMGGADAIAAKLQWAPPGTATELGDRWIAELDRHNVARAALIASIPATPSRSPRRSRIIRTGSSASSCTTRWASIPTPCSSGR